MGAWDLASAKAPLRVPHNHYRITKAWDLASANAPRGVPGEQRTWRAGELARTLLR